MSIKLPCDKCIHNYGGQVVPDMLQGWRYEERPQGEWIDHGYSFYICNNCGMGNNNAGGCKTNFCPNCGADMRKGSAETTFNDYLKEQLKDPEFKKEWEKLCDEDMRSDEE